MTSYQTGPSDSDHPVFPWLTERRRGYFYRLAFTVGALLVILGRAKSGDVAAALEVAGSVLGLAGTGLAIGHTDTAR